MGHPELLADRAGPFRPDITNGRQGTRVLISPWPEQLGVPFRDPAAANQCKIEFHV